MNSMMVNRHSSSRMWIHRLHDRRASPSSSVPPPPSLHRGVSTFSIDVLPPPLLFRLHLHCIAAYPSLVIENVDTPRCNEGGGGTEEEGEARRSCNLCWNCNLNKRGLSCS